MYRRFFIAGNAVDENEHPAEANSIGSKKVKAVYETKQDSTFF